MRALLLAAGPGTRLRPLTDTMPKCLVEIQGRPLLDYWFDLLFESGKITDVLVNMHHLADQVVDHLHRSRWSARLFPSHEPEMLGTAATVRLHHDWLSEGFGLDYLVAHADNLTDIDIRRLVRKHQRRPRRCVMTMAAYRTDRPKECGIITCGKDRVLTSFVEKPHDPAGKLANAAVYIFGEQVDYPDAIDISTDVLPHFVGRALVVKHRGYHRDIGTPESLALANREFRAQKAL